jgi:hypothetical protein
MKNKIIEIMETETIQKNGRITSHEKLKSRGKIYYIKNYALVFKSFKTVR